MQCDLARIGELVQPKYLYRSRPVSSLAPLRLELCAPEEGYIWTMPYGARMIPLDNIAAGAPRVGNSPETYQLHLLRLISEKDAMGICSFSETHTNEFMWAHCASGFSGLYILDDVRRLVEALPEADYLVRDLYDGSWLSGCEWRALGRQRGSLNLKPGSDVVTRFLQDSTPRWSSARSSRSL